MEDKESGMSELRRDGKGKKARQTKLEKRKLELGIVTNPVEKRKDRDGDPEVRKTVGFKRIILQVVEADEGEGRNRNCKEKVQRRKRKGWGSDGGKEEQVGKGTTYLER